MTPKEALNQLSGVAWQYLTDGYVTVNGKRYTIKDLCDINLKALTELEELKRYPTSDEVCEAFSGYYGVEVIYRKTDGFQVFRSRWNDGEYGDIYLEELIENPHLITLIGRFYQGVEKVGKEHV